MNLEKIPIVVLAGGEGRRMADPGVNTSLLPKPLVQVGGKPILWHILKTSAAQGAMSFFVLIGRDAELFEAQRKNFTEADWNVQLIETPRQAGTGGRLLALKPYLQDSPFILVYGDAVHNTDLQALVSRHQGAGKMITMTLVHPTLPFGVVEQDEGGLVTAFCEKPIREDVLANGGVFMCEPSVLEHIPSDAVMFEAEPLQHLISMHEVAAFVHTGFRHTMDTLKDRDHLETLWQNDDSPWKVWR